LEDVPSLVPFCGGGGRMNRRSTAFVVAVDPRTDVPRQQERARAVVKPLQNIHASLAPVENFSQNHKTKGLCTSTIYITSAIFTASTYNPSLVQVSSIPLMEDKALGKSCAVCSEKSRVETAPKMCERRPVGFPRRGLKAWNPTMEDDDHGDADGDAKTASGYRFEERKTSVKKMTRVLVEDEPCEHETATAAANGLATLHRPLRKQTYASDLVVVLDLDNCLVCSKFERDTGTEFAFQSDCKENDDTDLPCDSLLITLPGDTKLRCILRPGLFDFLRSVCGTYETHVFTAGVESYAKTVLAVLESEAGVTFSAKWYRQHCTKIENEDGDVLYYVKNLSHLGLSLNRTVLVDNNSNSFHAQPDNGLYVKDFFNDATDGTLSAVQEMLEVLRKEPDVRPFLRAKFGLNIGLNRPLYEQLKLPANRSSVSRPKSLCRRVESSTEFASLEANMLRTWEEMQAL
jgi:Dullard-like phosphatase family protein